MRAAPPRHGHCTGMIGPSFKAFTVRSPLVPTSLRSDRLIVFGRYPRPGNVKTRLIPTLGTVGAADFQRRLTERTLDTARKLVSRCRVCVEFRFEGGTRKQVGLWLGPDVLARPQGAGGLGKRMHDCMAEAFREGSPRVVLLGTDIPEVTTGLLEEAFQALTENDVVLGPSEDGGYWLVGSTRPTPLFEGIPWSTGGVFRCTVALARTLGLKMHTLRTLRDMDGPEDLASCPRHELLQSPYLSVIIPTLNEARCIEETIGRAKNGESQIIVVDGGSTDHTVEVARLAGAAVVSSPPGRAVQQNRGVLLANGRVLLFLHADTHLPAGFVGSVFETLMDSRAAGGAFSFKTDWDHPVMKSLEFLTNVRARLFRLPYGDQAIFLRKSLFERLGGFPQIPVAEDLFFVRRLAKLGRLGIVPNPAVTSARRWRSVGVVRNTIINQIIVAGCLLGVSPKKLACLHQRGVPQRAIPSRLS